MLFIKKWRNHTKTSKNFFAVLAMLVVPWVAQGQVFNYTCDFDDPSDTAGWVFVNGTQLNKWYIDTATHSSGTRSLYISNNNGVSNSYNMYYTSSFVYAYHELTLAAGGYSISYDWKCYGESNYDYIRVFLAPVSATLTAGQTPSGGTSSRDWCSAALPSGFISLTDSATKLNLQSSWQSLSTDFNIPSTGTYRLVFAWANDASSGTQPPAAIDNIQLGLTGCLPVENLSASNITQTRADITWIDTFNTTFWTVEFGISGFTLGTGTTLIVYDTTATLTSLTSNTPYDVYVTPDCTIGDAVTEHLAFRTACELLDSFPWTETFESCPIGSFNTGSSFIPCWGHLNNGTIYGGYPYVYNSSGYNHTPSGNKSLYWSSSTSTNYGDYCCAVLPEIDSTISINHLKLSFWVKGNIYTTPTTPFFQIGVMTDPTDISTFVGVDTIVIPTNGIWTLLEVPMSAYIGNGHNIAIKADRASSLWAASVDDMTIDHLSCIVPQQVFETNATTNSISFDWTDITPAIEWQIEYGPQGYTRGSSAGTLITTTTHPITITGLDTLATYDFYIRPICTRGDTADWSYPTSLTTAMCDNSSVCAIGSANSTGSTHCYPVNNYYNYSLSETIIDSTELGGPMDIEYIGYYYNHTAASTDKSNCTIYFQPTAKTVFSSSSDVEALNPATGVKVYEGHLNCSHGWNIFPLDTVYHYDGSGNLMIIVDDNSNDFNSISYTFKFEPCSGYKTIYYFSSTYNPDVTSITSAYGGFKEYAPCRAVTQLISCTQLSCHQPVITGTSNTYEDVTVTWSGESNSYEVNIKPTNTIDWHTPDIIVTGNNYTFHGLQPATGYTIRVRQDCRTDNLGYSEWITDTAFTDSLPCLTPDSLHTSEVTNATATFDWLVNGNETYWDIHVWHSDFDSIFRVSSRPSTLGGFSPGQTYDVAVRAICGSELHEGDWSDTIHFTTEQQDCDTVTDFTATNVTESLALLTWTPNNTDDEWEVVLTTAAGATVSEANTTESQYQLASLTPGTAYIAKVRTVCDDGQYSDFVSTSFTTETLGIDDVTAPTFTIYPNPTSGATTISVSGVNGKVRIDVVDMDGCRVATETLNCTGGCTKTMEVDKLAQGAYFVRIIGENANLVKKLIVR